MRCLLVIGCRKPIRPYALRIGAQGTRAGSSASSATAGQTQATVAAAPVEEIDPRSTPRNVGGMTTQGRENYRADFAEYQFEWRLYDTERQNVNQLSAWIRKTVVAQLYDTTCKADKTIDEWYAAPQGTRRFGRPPRTSRCGRAVQRGHQAAYPQAQGHACLALELGKCPLAST